ncbi:MAG: PAS domain-containing protein [Desulfatibacillum sp.]|nr:PAS domain-containing protein [Desulfatibacillum sp.]
MNKGERAKIKQLEHELLVISSRQEAILATLSDVIIIEVDTHNIFTWANQAGFAFFGDDVIGKEAAFYFAGEQTASQVVPSPLDEHHDLICFQNWQRRKDGEKRLLAWQGLVLKDESGNVAGALSSAHDITEQKRENERLQQIEERWLAITESTQDAILMMDPEGRVSFWNRAAERMFGYTSVEALGENLHDLIAPARFHQAYRTGFQEFQQTGQGSAVGSILDLKAIRKDRKEISVQLSLSAVKMNDGWHALGLIRDISDRKRVEEEIEQYGVELAKRNKELQDALTDIRQLTGMLPICAACKKIKDNKGYWQGVESYITKHSKAVFSHGLCPECEKKIYEDLEILKNENA